MAVNLTIYDVLQGPVLTDKARILSQDKHTLVIRVHPQANKPQIKQAIERLFNVKVQNVRTVIRKGKQKLNRKNRATIVGAKRKHAYINLASGYSLDFAGQAAQQGQTQGNGAQDVN